MLCPVSCPGELGGAGVDDSSCVYLLYRAPANMGSSMVLPLGFIQRLFSGIQEVLGDHLNSLSHICNAPRAFLKVTPLAHEPKPPLTESLICPSRA